MRVMRKRGICRTWVSMKVREEMMVSSQFVESRERMKEER
jgi:hypothetical protein